jgi:hypothetical protein
MDFGQASNFVLNVMRGEDQAWHVVAQDIHQPLASFDNPHSACAWAIAHAKPKCGSVVMEKIPVAWMAEGDSRYALARDPSRSRI